MSKIKLIFRKTKSFIQIILIKILNYLFMIFPIKENRVFFLSDQREELGANLKAIYDVVPDDKFEKVVSLKPDRYHHRKLKDKFKLIYYLTTSKYILLDDWAKSVSIMKRRKKQEIVQLWHGPGAFKTFGYSRMDNKGKSKYSMHRNYTKAIVTAEDIRWCYAEGFAMNIENVKATGFPRTDTFFDKKYKENIQKSFYQEYPELKNKKIILFAPTYRGSTLPTAYYDFEQLDLKKLQKALGKDYVFIIKWHPAVYNKLEHNDLVFDTSNYKGFVYDFSKKRDINDLLIVSDILITDYSSVIFDYLLLDKPIIYYTYDLEKYNEERGLYFDFEEYVYGNIATNIEELIKCIKKPSMDKEKRKKFYKKFMSACDGNSTKKTYEYIFQKKE